MEVFSLTIPMPYYKKNSKALFSLNVYRNAKYFLQNKFKKEYGDIIKAELLKFDSPKINKLSIRYVLHFKPTSSGIPRRVDLSNIASVVDKTFCDCLQELSWVDDDDISHIQKITYQAEPYSSKEYIEVIINANMTGEAK